MKKILSVFLSLTIVLTLFSGITAFAADDVIVEFDGKTLEFDVKPQIVDGRTLVPLRKIFEEIGAYVKWDGDTNTVSARKNSKTITLTIGSSDLNIDKGKTDDNGNPIIETVALEVPAQEVSGRTLVPARAISESFGLKVDWDEENQKVIITSDDDDDDSWKENEGSINLTDLSFEGEGVEIVDNQIKITKGGDYALSGTLADGNITISTKERVKLRLQGANITSSNGPCIFVEKADKAFITISGDTKNYLVAQNSDDGAIYSKENLEIKGNGSLEIKSLVGHGIKASDNLTIENGSITIDATTDGIHINDTFKMIGGSVNITAICDGIDCESIINISGGTINVETNGTPIETTQTTTETPRRGMWEDKADVEFEKSTKGINAEWFMCISGGDINVNSASHAIHCQDEIEITGGKFTLISKYDKGISAHGNLTISSGETTIDIAKSTEGLESKNVMTINDGIIKVVSSDDAINATGGNSGMMMPGGNFGGNGEGGNRTPPEGFENGAWGNFDPANRENNRPWGTQGTRPQRGENGEFAPNFTMPENGEFMMPEEMWKNGEFAPNFQMPENGEFTPNAGARPQTGENMGQGGFVGGFGRNAKECLIINGGYLELVGNDDCVDANGTMRIDGGTIMATNPTGSFTGNFGVLDADGQIIVGENANIILASASGNERSLTLSQNYIIVYCETQHAAKDTITISDGSGNVVYEYSPEGSFKTIMIASSAIKTGEKYSVTIGSETFDLEISAQSTVAGTQTSGGMGFGRFPGMR